MKQTRKMKRRRKRRLKKGFKILFITIPVIVALIIIIMYGFELRSVALSTDLNQFTTSEVKAYFDYKGIDNTLIFWMKSKLGMSDDIELFEQFSVKLQSPSKVKVTAYESKFKGYIENNKKYYFLDKNGTVLKISDEKRNDIPKITGLAYNKILLYKKVEAVKENVLESMLTVLNSIEEYDYKIKQVEVNDEAETSIYIEKLKIDLGKVSNLDKKLRDLNDMYDKIAKYDGTVNMKRASEDGSYTIKENEKKKSKK